MSLYGAFILSLFCFFFYFPVLDRSSRAIASVPVSHQKISLQERGTHGIVKDDLNPSAVILNHVLDGHSFHFFDYKGYAVGIDLPVILYSPQRGWSVFSSARLEHGHIIYEGYKLERNTIVPVLENGTFDAHTTVYDLSLTRNVVQLFLATFVFVGLSLYAARRYRAMASQDTSYRAPKGVQNMIESIVVFVRDEMAIPNLNKHAYKYLPLLLSIFFFILINNLFGLLPGAANVTGNITFTMVLSIVAFIVMIFSSKSPFWSHLVAPPGVPILVRCILVPVEFLGIFIKPFALMIRLFANMLAGHIIILCFILTIFIMGDLSLAAGWGFSPISVLFIVFIYMIELLVAFIQAYIFTTLTAVFIGQMIEDAH